MGFLRDIVRDYTIEALDGVVAYFDDQAAWSHIMVGISFTEEDIYQDEYGKREIIYLKVPNLPLGEFILPKNTYPVCGLFSIEYGGNYSK